MMQGKQPSQYDTIGNPSGTTRYGSWQVAGRFQTIEQARRTADRLIAAGQDSRISLIGGLSVITRCPTEV